MSSSLANISKLKVFLVLLSAIVLISVYLLQRFNYAGVLAYILSTEMVNHNVEFIINRTLRLIINDLAVILLLYALFNDKGLLKLAFSIQFFEILVILPIYFYLKLLSEGPSEISSPLLSFIHRIVVNPIIMLLLIPAFWFQKKSS